MPKYTSYIKERELPKINNELLQTVVYPVYPFNHAEELWKVHGLSLETLQQLYNNIRVIRDEELVFGIQNLTRAVTDLGGSIYDTYEEAVGVVDSNIYLRSIKRAVFSTLLSDTSHEYILKNFYDQNDIELVRKGIKEPSNYRMLDRVFPSNAIALALGLWELRNEDSDTMRWYVSKWTSIPENGIYEGYIASTKEGLTYAKSQYSTLIANLYTVPVVKDILQKSQVNELTAHYKGMQIENSTLCIVSTKELQYIPKNFFPFLRDGWGRTDIS